MDTIERLLAAHAIASQDPRGAEAICREVLAASPGDSFALHLLGVLLLKSGRPREATKHLREAMRSRPDGLETKLALAEALMRDREDVAAVSLLRGVVAGRPRHAPALAALAMGLLRLGYAVEAVEFAERARAVDPEAIEPMVAHGTALSATRRLDEARDLLAAALDRAPGHSGAHLNLGNLLLDMDEEAEAERHLREAAVLDPTTPEVWASLGFLLAGADRLEEAVEACDTAIKLRPDFAQAYWNRSFARLRAGDFPGGWADYEWRARHPKFGHGKHILPGPHWAGGSLVGRHLLVNATQGFGDTIQLARYLPLLAERGARITVACPRSLIRLLSQLPAEFVPRDGALPQYDVWVDQMSLPRLFETTPDNIPSAVGYLRATARPRSGAAFHVGVVCAGNPAHSNDFRRSMPAAALRPLRDIPGVAFTSLQLGHAAPALAEVLGLPAEPPGLVDFAATAESIASLDLVISVDTAVAHLAGALGKPVWIMIPRAPDWRWLAERDDTPWYASARLFRQQRAGDWPDVIGRVAASLQHAPALVC